MNNGNSTDTVNCIEIEIENLCFFCPVLLVMSACVAACVYFTDAVNWYAEVQIVDIITSW
jgi:hypothetical protein